MSDDERRVQDSELRRYLTARAEAAARQASASETMTRRLAAVLGLVRPAPSGGTWLLRVGVVVAILALIVVALGIGTQPPRPSPTPTPSATPRPNAPSPVPLQETGTLPMNARAIESTATAVWVLDVNGLLAELDPAGGAAVRSVQLGPDAEDLLVTADSVWVASTTGDLVRVDLGNLATTSLPGVRGGTLSAGPDAIWLGTATGLTRIDPATNTVDGTVRVANRDANLGIAADADSIWVATRTAIQRLDAADGSVTGQINGDASRLAFGGGFLWAVRGTELLRIDPAEAAIRELIPGLPVPSVLVAANDRIWVAGPSSGGPVGTVVGISVATGFIDVAAETVSARDMAVGPATIWVISASDADAGTIHRFATP